jgi:hypothetical protein
MDKCPCSYIHVPNGVWLRYNALTAAPKSAGLHSKDTNNP